MSSDGLLEKEDRSLVEAWCEILAVLQPNGHLPQPVLLARLLALPNHHALLVTTSVLRRLLQSVQPTEDDSEITAAYELAPLRSLAPSAQAAQSHPRSRPNHHTLEDSLLSEPRLAQWTMKFGCVLLSLHPRSGARSCEQAKTEGLTLVSVCLAYPLLPVRSGRRQNRPPLQRPRRLARPLRRL